MNRLPFRYRNFVGVLLLLYAAVQVYCINQLSLNYDEGLFASYGASILKMERDKDVVLYESKLPITALNMVPRAVEQVLHPGLKKAMEQANRDVINGRYISLLVAITLGLLIFRWSRELYNESTAVFVLIFYLLCPNFLAHGIFVSSDIFACLFMTAALYYLWKFFQQPLNKHFILMSVATALAQISKFSMVHLFLLVIFLFAIGVYVRRKHEAPFRFGVRRLLGLAFVFLFINWIFIVASHLFFQVFLPINEYHFRSNAFISLQQFLLRVYPKLPVPLPSSYIRSMDAVMYFDQLGGGVKGSLNGAPYILGKHSVNGFWYYYMVSIFFKVPISVLLLWISALFIFLRKYSRSSFLSNDIFLLLPAFYYLLYMSLFYSTQVGIRHLLIIFPLLFVFSGKVVALASGRRRVILYALVLYQLVSVAFYFPHFLPYTNEFILNKKLAYQKIGDTNLCYGEGARFLQHYLSKNPTAVYMPERPVNGKVVFEINELLDMNIATAGQYRWAQNLVPVDHIHSEYLIFDVSQREADSLQRVYPNE